MSNKQEQQQGDDISNISNKKKKKKGGSSGGGSDSRSSSGGMDTLNEGLRKLNNISSIGEIYDPLNEKIDENDFDKLSKQNEILKNRQLREINYQGIANNIAKPKPVLNEYPRLYDPGDIRTQPSYVRSMFDYEWEEGMELPIKVSSSSTGGYGKTSEGTSVE